MVDIYKGFRDAHRFRVLRRSVADAIVRVPELDRVVVAAGGEDDAACVHVCDSFPDLHTLGLFDHAHCCSGLVPGKLAGKTKARVVHIAMADRASQQGQELLSSPEAEDEEFCKPLSRGSCSYENLSAKFRVQQRNYTRQYAQVYFSRLMTLTPHVEREARKKWGV